MEEGILPAAESPAGDPAADPAKDPVTDPAKGPVADPVADPAKGPVADPAKGPVTDPAKGPASTAGIRATRVRSLAMRAEAIRTRTQGKTSARVSAALHDSASARRKWSVLRYLPRTMTAVRAVLVVNLAASVGVFAGCVTPLSAAIAFLSLVSLQTRNPYMCHAGDSVLRLMTFLLIFTPAGQAFSVDAALLGQGSSIASPWAPRLMQIQVSVLYFRAFQWKLKGKTWRDGTAAYYPLHCLDYRRFRAPALLSRIWLVRAATWGTLVLEAALGPLVWIRELRYPLLAAGILMHVVFDAFINIQLFGPTMVASLVLFVPPEDMQRWLSAR